MDMEELQTLVVLANSRSFTKTAKQQHIVQSTVSNRIRSLEEYAGVQLVIRDKTGIKFTPEGEIFLEYAKRILELDQSALHELHMLKNFDDRLNIAGPQWIMDYFLKDALIDFHKKHDHIAIKITVAHSEEIIPLLEDQIFDLAVISYKVSSPNLFCIPFCSSDIIFVGEKQKYGYLEEGIYKEDLTKLPLIYSDIWENYLFEISDHILSDRGIFKLECNMLGNAKEFCEHGLGCCFFPKNIVEKELKEEKLAHIPIVDLPVKHFQTYAVYNKSRMNSLAVKSWMQK